jgi:hypothetical protein
MYLERQKMVCYKQLTEFAINRDMIFHKVYVDDEILNKYRFCNIRRRDDRVTQWLLKNYYTNNVGDVWFKALIARTFNWPPTLKYLMERDAIPHRVEEFDVPYFTESLLHLEDKGVKIFNGAYVLFPTNYPGSKCVNIPKYILQPTEKIADKVRCAIEWDSIEETTKALASSWGIKTFIAGQVSADLTYLMGELNHAKDMYTWAPMGPGSIKGLNRLYQRDSKYVIKEDQFVSELIQTRGELIKANSLFDDLTLHDVQNVFCEFSKYMRTKDGLGKPKQLYKPTKEF